MKRLPLYPRLPITPIETVERLDPNPACTRCELSKGVETPCIPAMGAPGGVLVVSEAPGKREDQSGQPFTGAAGVWFAAQLKKHWNGPVAVTNAIGCYPGKTRERSEVKVSVEGARDHVEACRPYLARVIEQIRPKRILVLGSLALLSVMGKALVPLKARRSYGWLFCLPMSAHLRDLEESNGQDGDVEFARALGAEADRVARGERPDYLTDLLVGDVAPHAIPVFLLIPPAQAMRNRFVLKALEADLEWALTCTPELPPLDAVAEIIETAEDSQTAVDDLAVGLAGMDVETGGIAHEKSFRVSSLAAARENRAYVWDQRALEDPVVSAPMREYVESPKARKIGAHFQYDLKAIHVGLGWRVRGVAGDVRLRRKLLDTEALGKLDEMVWLVGMGGMKDEAGDAMKAIAKRVRSGLREEALQAKRAEADREAQAAGMKVRKWPKRPPNAATDLAYWHAIEARDPLLAGVIRRQQDGEISGDAQEKDKAWTYALLAYEQPEIEQRYNALDALGTEHVSIHLDREFDREPEGLRIVRDTIVDPAVPAIARLEEWGIPASTGAIQVFDSWLAAQLVPVLAKLAQYPVENWRSSQQVGKFLFSPKPDGLGLKAPKQTDAGADSTGKGALESLRDAHPVIGPLLELKRIMKLRDVYAGSKFPEGMLEHVREDGRIHCTVFLDGAACMPAGELVMTSRGYLPVEKVRVGDLVLTHEGRTRPVIETVVNPPTPVVRVRLSNGLALHTTWNHGYLTARGWVRADQLQVGDVATVHNDPEEWRTVTEWPYVVSSWGRVRHVPCKRYPDGTSLQPQRKGKWGHLKVCFDRGDGSRPNGNRHDFPVHRLVAAAFLGPATGPEVRHLNGIAWDNSVGNLAWGDTTANRADGRRHGTYAGLAPKLTSAQVEQIRAIPKVHSKRARGNTTDMGVAAMFGVTREHVRDIRSGRRRTDLRTAEDKERRVTFGSALVVDAVLLPAAVTYGLTVEDDASHVTGGIVTHNTGRASATNGLHQIPGKKFPVEGKMARDCFPAPPGKVILSVDLSQVELRRAADLSGDPEMIAIFKSGIDYHLRTAQLIAETAWGISPDEVGEEHRAQAKGVNFGLIYGRGDRALAMELFHTQAPTPKQVAVAAKIRAAILGRFKVFAAWIKARHKEVRETGEVWTLLDSGKPGRRRRLWDIASADDFAVSNAQNASQNTPCQSKASDDLLRSLIKTIEWIDAEEIENDVKVVLPVHDQMLLEVTAGSFVDDVADVVIPIMEGWPSEAGLIADLEIGPSWGSLRKMKRTTDGWKCFINKIVDPATGLKKDVYSPAFRSAWAAYDFAMKAAEVARERA